MTEDRKLDPATLAAQALGWIDETTGAIVPPLHTSTTYERGADNTYPSGRIYARDDNPAYDQAEALLAALEGGAGCLIFASGMAAAGAVFETLGPGSHVVVPQVMYHGLRSWLLRVGAPAGLDVDFVSNGDLTALEAALRPGETRLVWVETPANPTWDITDIAAAAELAHAAGARLAVDSTAATPVLTRPLDLGADLVMHSATKYLNGHADVVAGALVTARDDEHWRLLGERRRLGGAVLGSFEAWLLLRGMRTLYVRLPAACRSAQAVAERLGGHPAIAEVHYPGLAGHPGHEVAARQMRGGFGGTLSVRVAGGEAAAIAVAARVRVFKRATSLGGTESLIEHRASIEEGPSLVPADLLRLSIGIEDTDDLIADLEQALAGAAR